MNQSRWIELDVARLPLKCSCSSIGFDHMNCVVASSCCDICCFVVVVLHSMLTFNVNAHDIAVTVIYMHMTNSCLGDARGRMCFQH